MKSLTSLVRHAGPGDPLAQVVGALLDSGLIVTTRDGAGRYVQLSPVYGRELGIEDLDGRGSTVVEGYHYFDAGGREISRMEHPSQVARLSGEPQRLRVGGARRDNGREAWMINSYLPLGRDDDGWEVLTLGVPLPRSVFHPPTDGAGAGAVGPFQQSLLEFALAVAGVRLCEDELAEAMRPAAATILDDPLSASLVTLHGDCFHARPLVRLGEPACGAEPARLRVSEESAARWRMTETYYNPSVGDADVLGDRVVIEFPSPIRTYALVPLHDGCGRRVASVGVTAGVRDAVSRQQRVALEQLARLAGPVLAQPA